ncbi:2673_t:CDS:2 [Cetraspora pellucida]|uniref:2673_t:CDS:1 n=1 Tax=Cetraspora pellucida TaxID=1433469 RepID=A0ACA9K187_9GLOM|nr:2673_t:CDS:2 [Cetraspora pellucida]
MNHIAFADNTLIAQRINKGLKRKQNIMRPTTFININSQVKVQEMFYCELNFIKMY